jgi:pimeloyl-ACP methyl ester carboxylesterase
MGSNLQGLLRARQIVAGFGGGRRPMPKALSSPWFATVDLLGFSPLLAAEQPKLVRKLLLVGTAPQAGDQILKRESARTMDRDPESREAIRIQQAKTLGGRCAIKDPNNKVLERIDLPVLIKSARYDSNAYFMLNRLKNAQLFLCPRRPWRDVPTSGALRQSCGAYFGGIVRSFGPSGAPHGDHNT